MQPVRALLDGARSILVSPDGALSLVPLGALVDERGSYLVETLSITYLTSGRDLLRQRAPRAAQAQTESVVVADPDFNEPSVPLQPRGGGAGRRSANLSHMTLSPLRATAAEATAIAQYLGDARVLLGEEATEEAVKSLHRPRVLHLATHGFFLPNQNPILLPHQGFLGGAFPQNLQFGLENPLLRSGLALAGFNQRSSGKDDGVLTALEVAGLDLHGTRLVVLSACETGLGQASGGDGVYGLRRALVLAGAETHVMSLWKVDDAATREQMEAYYMELRAGKGRSEAMRAVQLAMLGQEAGKHPYYWASFIVSGDGSPLDEGGDPARLPQVPPRHSSCMCDVAGGEPLRTTPWHLLVGFSIILGRRACRTAVFSSCAQRLHQVARVATLVCFLAVAGCIRSPPPRPEVTLIRTTTKMLPRHGHIEVSAIQVPERAVDVGVIWVQSKARFDVEALFMRDLYPELLTGAISMGANFIKIEYVSTGFFNIEETTGGKRPINYKMQLGYVQILGRAYWVPPERR